MNRDEADKLASLALALWPTTRWFPDPDKPKLTASQQHVLDLWAQAMNPHAPEYVEARLRNLAQQQDAFPSWVKIRETLGVPKAQQAMTTNCKACKGEGLAEVIMSRRGGAFPQYVYTISVKCICQGPAHGDRLRKQHEQIRDRLDRARHLDAEDKRVTYRIMLMRDLDALQKDRADKGGGGSSSLKGDPTVISGSPAAPF